RTRIPFAHRTGSAFSAMRHTSPCFDIAAAVPKTSKGPAKSSSSASSNTTIPNRVMGGILRARTRARKSQASRRRWSALLERAAPSLRGPRTLVGVVVLACGVPLRGLVLVLGHRHDLEQDDVQVGGHGDLAGGSQVEVLE